MDLVVAQLEYARELLAVHVGRLRAGKDPQPIRSALHRDPFGIARLGLDVGVL